MNSQQAIKRLQEQLWSIVQSKKEQPLSTPRVTLDWRHAQLSLVECFCSEKLLIVVIAFQQKCISHKVSCFHSFFAMQWAKSQQEEKAISELEEQTKLIEGGKSKYQSICGYIKMREHLIGKVSQFSGNYLKALFEDIDDIRFLNFQIVTLIESWKQQWRISSSEPVFYSSGMNYLLKMTNDNADLINLANFKKTKFISPPNPFFLSEDGNLTSMAPNQKQQIDRCLIFINKERTIDLRLAVQGAPFVLNSKDRKTLEKRNPKRKVESKEISFTKEAKEEMEFKKQNQIRNIYAIKSSVSSSRLRAQKQSQIAQNRRLSKQQREIDNRLYASQNKKDETKEKDKTSKLLSVYASQKKLQKKQISPKKQTQSRQLQEPKMSKTSIKIQKQSPFKQKRIDPTKNSRVSAGSDRLRSTIDKALGPTQPLIQVKQIKPKIKMLEQKQSSTQQTAKTILSFSFESLLAPADTKKNRSFYKQIEPILEEEQPIVPPTSNKEEQIEQQIESKKGKEEHSLPKKISMTQVDFNLRKHRPIKSTSKSQIKQTKPADMSQTVSNQLGKHLQSSFITEVNQPKRYNQTSQLSQRLNQQNKKEKNQFHRLSSQVQSKISANNKQLEKLKTQRSRVVEVQEQLENKARAIEELYAKIKAIEQKKRPIKIQNQPSPTNKYFEREKKKSEIEAKIIRDKIKMEEQILKKNQQRQLRLKEQQLQRDLKRSIMTVEQQHKQKIIEYQKQLLLEEKKLKQTQHLINLQRGNCKSIQQQLSQQNLKQKLLQKILTQKQKKYQQQLASAELTEQQTRQQLEKQMKEKEKMEAQALKLIEDEKKKIEKVYQQLLLKNQEMEKENQQKNKLIQQLATERQEQLSKLQKLQEELNKKTQQQVQQTPQQPDYETLKLKIKEQVMQQMLKKQQQEEEQIQAEEERKKQRLKRIQEEVALAMKEEEERIERQNQQFLNRLEELRKKNEIQSFALEEIKRRQIQNGDEYMKKQEQQIPQFMTEMEERSHPILIQKEQQRQLINVQHHKAEIKIQNNDHAEPSLIKLQNNQEEQQSPEIQKIEQKQQLKQDDPMVQPSTHQQATIQVKSLEKREEQILPKEQDNIVPPQSPIRKMKQAQQNSVQEVDLLQKYKNIGQYLRKSRQIVVEDSNLSIFLDSFLSNFDKTTKEMLPWSKEQLEKNLVQKKGDIFDCGTIGWLEQKGKYTMLGSIECVDSVAKKYGAVQVHQLLHFDKNSTYQKQVLAKKIKQFQKIGFVFQKKISNNIFSIRFVIKIPVEIAGPPKTFSIELTTRMTVQGHSENNDQFKQTHGYSYIFSRILKEVYTEAEIEGQLSGPGHFNKSLKKHLVQGLLPPIKNLSIEETSGSIEMKINLSFRYLRQKNRMFYLVNCSQYLLEDSHSFVCWFGNTDLCLVLQEHRLSAVPLDYFSFQSVERLSKAQKTRNIDVLLPIWEYTNNAMLNDYAVTSNFREKVTPQLLIPSVVSTFMPRHNYVELGLPFLAILCQGRDGIPIRPIQAHYVTAQELVYQNMQS